MESAEQLKGPCSCDTFVVLPPGTPSQSIVFGKNSDRPYDEVQEVVFIPATENDCSAKLKCTYIEIEQAAHTHAVILSKPSWMWGAEMGANEHGVCIGNEAVWTKLNGPEDSVEKLLGMDLVRLGLERAATAAAAVQVIVSLLEQYGQGGNCSDTIPSFTYHNSFLIADCSEAWVLETAGKLWAAEKVTSGVRNISNELSISKNIDLMSPDLKQYAQENDLWDPSEPFSFKKCFSLDDDDEGYRYRSGRRLLNTMSHSGNFKETDMFKILRDKRSGICMPSGAFVSTGSQVSVLYPPQSGKPCCHWFTGTPDPSMSVFKPFIFVDGIEFPGQIVSPAENLQKPTDRRHELYKLHEGSRQRKKSSEAMTQKKCTLEAVLIGQVSSVTDAFAQKASEAKVLLKNAVEMEMQMYT